VTCPSRTDDGVDAVTAREREVLRLLALGLNDPQIATAVGISQGAVKADRASVAVKLAALRGLASSCAALEQEACPVCGMLIGQVSETEFDAT